MQETPQQYIQRIVGYVESKDPLKVQKATPDKLAKAIKGLKKNTLSRRPAPDKWSIVEILAHLADTELVGSWRMRLVLGANGTPIQPFDQDVWATRYSAYSAADALRTFFALRAWNLALLTTVSAAERLSTLNHPERGVFPFTEMLESIAGHDRNHLLRLKEQLAR